MVVRKPRTILVVDRDPVMTTLISEVLHEAGYRVQTAAGRAAALAVWRVHPPDLILIDVSMPRMSGRELLHAAALEGLAPVPAILMTAAHPIALRAWGRDAATYLFKPFDMVELLASIERALDDAP